MKCLFLRSTIGFIMIAFGRVMLVSVFWREKEFQYCKAIALGADLPMSNAHDPELKL